MEAHSIVNTLRYYYPAMFAATPGKIFTGRQIWGGGGEGALFISVTMPPGFSFSGSVF